MTLKEQEKKIWEHDDVLYRDSGNGQPGIITRLFYGDLNQDACTEELKSMRIDVDKMKIQWAKLSAYVGAAMFFAILLGHLADNVISYYKGH
jgi:hypothetical protein